VITDRQVLDRQLQDAIYQIEHAQGVVKAIDQDSKQLAAALIDGTKIARSARQAPRALLFHDRPTASDLLERRLVAAGRPPGTGASLASTVFDVIDGKRSITARAFVASVVGQE